MAKTIMVQGTASGVGKTMLTLALCRIFKQKGYKVAPFKALNMTSNTRVNANREEISVSQWLQAQAAGVEATPYMNPLILKPATELAGTQVIANGQSLGLVDNEHLMGIQETLAQTVKTAYAHMMEAYDIIVIEGAGSPVELNLNKKEIVNMGMAALAQAPVLLVGDIDRGGIFASLYGTVNLLTPAQRRHVKALVVNRFMGDPRYFAEGVEILEEITQLPVAGVIPHMPIHLPEEDGADDTSHKTDEASLAQEFDRIAANVANALNMELIYHILEEGM